MTIEAHTGTSEALEDAALAGREAAERALGGRRPERGLCLFFSSPELPLEEVMSGLREVLGPGFVLAGCTTFSEVTETGYHDESVSVLLLHGAELRFGVGWGQGVSRQPAEAVRSAWNAAMDGLGAAPTAAFVLPDAALSLRAEEVVATLAELAGGVPVAGGCPGDGNRFKAPRQGFQGQVAGDSALVVLFGAPLRADVVTRSGWVPVGEVGVATRSEGSRVVTIDERPATDFLRRYIGQSELHPEVIGTMPLALVDESAVLEGRRLHVIRSPFFHEPESGALIYAGCVPQGAHVQLGHTSRDLLLESARDCAASLSQSLAGRAPLCVLMASCGGRKLMLGLDVAKEPVVILELLPPATPLAGFYSYGEIGAFESTRPGLDTLRYHNCTLVLMALGLAT